jgi:hypothetical protein
MIANDCIRAQGRSLSLSELVELQVLIDEHPHWSRHGVAKELCQRWDWRTPAGQLKTFAARSLLLKLAQRYELWKARREFGLEVTTYNSPVFFRSVFLEKLTPEVFFSSCCPFSSGPARLGIYFIVPESFTISSVQSNSR